MSQFIGFLWHAITSFTLIFFCNIEYQELYSMFNQTDHSPIPRFLQRWFTSWFSLKCKYAKRNFLHVHLRSHMPNYVTELCKQLQMQWTTLIFPSKILRVKKENFNFEALIILKKSMNRYLIKWNMLFLSHLLKLDLLESLDRTNSGWKRVLKRYFVDMAFYLSDYVLSKGSLAKVFCWKKK